jgi:tRNA pseudouridine55 synthase
MVDGYRAYKLARQGNETELKAKPIHIDEIELTDFNPDTMQMSIRVSCGKGTYIRTLCDDLGVKCGCPAHMRSLLRTRSGAFTIDNAIPLEEARALAEAGTLTGRMLPPDWPLGHLPRTDVPERMSKRVANGAKIPLGGWNSPVLPEGGVTRVYLDNEFWGLAVREGKELAWKAQIAPEAAEEKQGCE